MPDSLSRWFVGDGNMRALEAQRAAQLGVGSACPQTLSTGERISLASVGIEAWDSERQLRRFLSR
jgi:hypothetical protein